MTLSENAEAARIEEMTRIADAITAITLPYARIEITYSHETDETAANWSDFERRYHDILPGDEYFIIRKEGHMLYAVNVTFDSALTAAAELMDLVSRKF